MATQNDWSAEFRELGADRVRSALIVALTVPLSLLFAFVLMRFKSVDGALAVMNKEVDGFIINRLQFAVLREAWSMWANGIASAEAIDACFKMSLGRRYAITGPIESAELGGLDRVLSAMTHQ